MHFLKRWWKDDLFRHVFKNAAHLGSGKALAGIGNWGVLLIETRSLNVGGYGMLVLLISYVEAIRAIARFQSWQLVLHYAAIPWKRKNLPPVLDAIRFSFGLDFLVGFIAMLAGMLGVFFFGEYFGISAGHQRLAYLCCTLLPAGCGTTETGVLRLLDRVDLLVREDAVNAWRHLLLCVLVWYAGGDLTGFALAWYANQLAGQLYIWTLARRGLKKVDLAKALWPSLKAGQRMPAGTYGFILTSSVNVLLFSSWKPLTNLIIGRILGPATAGLYQLSTKLLSALDSPAGLLEKNCYPEIVRLDPRTARPWKFTFRFCLLSLCIGIAGIALIAVGGKTLLGLFGKQYVHSAPLLFWMAPALLFETLVAPLDGILFTSDQGQAVMRIEGAGIVIYMILLVALASKFGLPGAGIAYVLSRALLACLMVGLCLSLYRRRASLIPPHERT